MMNLLPIANRRTRGVTLASPPPDSESDEDAVPSGGKTAKAARPVGAPTPRILAGPAVARAAPAASPSQPSPTVITGPPRVVRVVKFAPTPTNQVVEVTPYSQVYGMPPAKFEFDPNAPNGIAWLGTPVSSPEAAGSPTIRFAAQHGTPSTAAPSTAAPTPQGWVDSSSQGGSPVAPSALVRSADGVLVAPPVYVTPPRAVVATPKAIPRNTGASS